MNANSLAKYRRTLEALRGRLRADASVVAEQARGPSGGQAHGGLSNAPFHLGDGGSDEFLYDMTSALAENEQYLVREVNDALARLDGGSYGRCENCGAVIAAERLEAMPFARHCHECAERLQAGLNVNLNTGRPSSPSDTLAPEGAMQESWRPSVEAARGAGGRNVLANDEHAVGEPGGGAAIGGLAGSNAGDGAPEISDLQDAAGSGDFDFDSSRDDAEAPRSGRSGGAVGGTPARKRAK
jgi:RNA polymerase-binding transcription factor DksA